MNTLETLKAARQLIASPDNWTKGFFARDAKGKAIPVHYKRATCFCLVGSIMRITGRESHQWSEPYTELQRNMKHQDSLSNYNDAYCRKHRDILALFDRTIAKLETKP